MQNSMYFLERLPYILGTLVIIFIIRAYVDAWCIQCWYKRNLDHGMLPGPVPGQSQFQKILNTILFLPKI